MRCMNCGWDNLSNTTVCLKCGQPLRMPENYANSQDIFLLKAAIFRKYNIKVIMLSQSMD